MHQSAAVAAGPVAPAGETRLHCAPADAKVAESEAIRVLAAMYDRHAAMVLSVCRARLGRGLDEAEDACQEVFMRAHRKILEGAYPLGERAPQRWLYATARHVCRERQRASRRRRHHEFISHRNNGALTSASPPASAATARQEAMARVGAAIAQLPEREQLALHFQYLESDPIHAARETMKVSRSGYYKLLARARGRIARHLGITPSTGQP